MWSNAWWVYHCWWFDGTWVLIFLVPKIKMGSQQQGQGCSDGQMETTRSEWRRRVGCIRTGDAWSRPVGRAKRIARSSDSRQMIRSKENARWVTTLAYINVHTNDAGLSRACFKAVWWQIPLWCMSWWISECPWVDWLRCPRLDPWPTTTASTNKDLAVWHTYTHPHLPFFSQSS